MNTVAAMGRRPTTALYARVSKPGQSPESQIYALRRHADARAWVVEEFIDQSVSGKNDRRPALDRLMKAARARQVDIVAVAKLDRLARSTRHLVGLAAELEALHVD